MNHKLHLKISLISTLLLAKSFALAATPMPIELKPIRMAKGTVQIDRMDTTWNAAKNDINITITPVCKQSYDVPVFDVRHRPQNAYTQPGMVKCTDVVNSEALEIVAGSSFNIVDGAALSLPSDIKMYSGFAYLGFTNPTTTQIPYIQSQDSFTVDLNQVNFGLIAMAPAGALCMISPEPVEPPSPAPRLMTKKVTTLEGVDPDSCTIVHPVSYQAIWMAEDRP